MENKYLATKISITNVSDSIKNLVDRRTLSNHFYDDFQFEHETYSTPLIVSVKNTYTYLTVKWFKENGCSGFKKESIFRVSDYKYVQNRGMYHIDVELDYTKYQLNYYKENFKLNFDPPFQRGYVWSDKQRKEYVEYLVSGGVSGREIYFNCPNWMTGDDSKEMVVVDGKQRLSAIVDFIDEKFTIFDNIKLTDLRIVDKNRIRWSCNINSISNEIDIIKWYLSMNTGGSVHTEEDLSSAKNELIKLTKK